MPGYPNQPNTDPDEKKQVRPNDGNGTAVGADIAATLTVDNGGGDVDSDTVEIRIIDPTDPNSTAPLDNPQIDVNIAIQEGLRYLYLTQSATGGWPGSVSYDCAATGYALWAVHNQEHLPRNDPTQDILVKTSRKALDFLFGQAANHPTVAATNADVARGATAAGVSDLNSNGRAINLCPGENLYSQPIAAAGIVSSLADSAVISAGAYAGTTHKTFIEDVVDHLGTV